VTKKARLRGFVFARFSRACVFYYRLTTPAFTEGARNITRAPLQLQESTDFFAVDTTFDRFIFYFPPLLSKNPQLLPV